MKPIASLHYAKHSQQAISKASKWGHLGICDDSPERCWIHKSSKRLVMLSIALKTNSTVALDPPPPIASDSCCHYLHYNIFYNKVFFFIWILLLQNICQSPGTKLYKPHTLTQTVCRTELDEGVVFSFSPISCLIPSQNHLTCTCIGQQTLRCEWKLCDRAEPLNVDQESDLKTADVCCLKLLLWVWFWFSLGLLPCTPWIFLGMGVGGLGFQYFKEWQSLLGCPRRCRSETT